MNVLPVSNVAATASSPIGGSTKVASDFETFLRMLTVQMQNQDPLNPIDSADYAVQLATFSGVEQQVRTNQLLADMQMQLQQADMAEMAGWIGREARSSAPVRFDGTPVILSPKPASGATAADLVVRDMQGRLIVREAVPTSTAPYTWLGADATGMPLPPGNYQLLLESRNGEEVISTTPVEYYARIIEIRGAPEGTKLVLNGGVEVLASQITALREASN